MENKIPTHDPYTGELNPYYEELTGERNPLLPEIEDKIPTFDLKTLVGKRFKYKGKYGISNWTDKVRAITQNQRIEFDPPFKIETLNEVKQFNANKIRIYGYGYSFYVISERSGQHYEFEDCIFLID